MHEAEKGWAGRTARPLGEAAFFGELGLEPSWFSPSCLCGVRRRFLASTWSVNPAHEGAILPGPGAAVSSWIHPVGGHPGRGAQDGAQVALMPRGHGAGRNGLEGE